MEALLASAIGLLAAVGIYLTLRLRTFPVILGLTFLSYSVNLFLFTAGRLAMNAAPIVGTTDPVRLVACAAADEVPLSREEWYALFTAARGGRVP